MTKYYGQYKQDEFLNETFFHNKEGGTFVDIGAHDGITINNSLFFEKNLNWSGVCVEPLTTIYMKLKENRNCTVLNCAVDEEDGQTEFVQNTGYTEMLSGILKHYDSRHTARRDHEIKHMGGETNVVKVNTLRLETIFDVHNIKKVEYLSIDVEGGEFSVIKSINFDKVFIDIIGFEDNYPDVSVNIRKYLEDRGYVFITRLGGDIMMIHKDSEYKTQ